MKKTLLICGALLMFAAPAFSTGFINMMWVDCPLGPGFVNVSNTCTSNGPAPAGTLVTSFGPPVDMPLFLGCAGVIDLQTSAVALSPWWHMETGGCRAGKISFSADFTLGPFSCIDPWGGLASGGIDYATPSPGLLTANSARIRTLQAVGTPVPITVLDGLGNTNEYYAFKVTISKALSTSVGSCAGCLDKACFVFNSLRLSQPAPVPDKVVTSGPQQYTTYNLGTGTAVCPHDTPTRRSTWGSVKSLYR
ncbi:MAG: hypothetical protein HYR73_09595 [Candidatus Eisenbacteria bacterium]|nr:hypothetical protein [Candidatus Eisenbacteria bacterium]